MHGVIDDNSNRYKSIVMNKMRMNQDDTSECSIIDEESNKDVAMFFDLLKGYNKLLWDGCISHNKLSTIAWCSPSN